MIDVCGSPEATAPLSPPASRMVRLPIGLSPAFRHSGAPDPSSLAAIAGPARAPAASAPVIAVTSARRTPWIRRWWTYIGLDLLGRAGWCRQHRPTAAGADRGPPARIPVPGRQIPG